MTPEEIERTIGITTTVPVEAIFAAGLRPLDLNNIFITSGIAPAARRGGRAERLPAQFLLVEQGPLLHRAPARAEADRRRRPGRLREHARARRDAARGLGGDRPVRVSVFAGGFGAAGPGARPLRRGAGHHAAGSGGLEAAARPRALAGPSDGRAELAREPRHRRGAAPLDDLVQRFLRRPGALRRARVRADRRVRGAISGRTLHSPGAHRRPADLRRVLRAARIARRARGLQRNPAPVRHAAVRRARSSSSTRATPIRTTSSTAWPTSASSSRSGACRA